MVMNLILVFMVCRCYEYVMTTSIGRKDLGYRFIGYLQLPSFKLTYRKDSVGRLDDYTGSDWGNSLSRLSTTGLIARYNRGPVL